MCLNVNQRHCIQRNGHSTCFNPGSTGERFDEPTAKSCVVEGKKTHVMVMWCATNPGNVFAGYFHACTTMLSRWNGSWVAVLGFHTNDPALARCSVKELMSVRDVGVPQNSRRPVFGPSTAPEGRPLNGQPSQSNGRVKNGLLDLCRTQTSRHDISSLPSECTTNRVLPKKIFQKPDSRPFKFYSPRIHIGERYLPIGCCICVWIFTFHGDIDPWIAAFWPGPDSPKVVQGPKKPGGTSKIWKKRGYIVVDLGTNIHTTVN